MAQTVFDRTNATLRVVEVCGDLIFTLDDISHRPCPIPFVIVERFAGEASVEIYLQGIP